MPVTFYTDAYENIMMHDEYAKRFLKWMGQSGTVPGALLANDIPQALSQLEQNIKNNTVATPSKDKDEDETPVPIANRAFPLINLLKAADQQRCHVMWK